MSIAATPDGGGYWITTMDGVVHAFGDASLWPSTGGSVGASTTGGVSTPDGLGYWTANDRGAVEGYGDAALAGSMLGRPLNAPVVAISTLLAPAAGRRQLHRRHVPERQHLPVPHSGSTGGGSGTWWWVHGRQQHKLPGPGGGHLSASQPCDGVCHQLRLGHQRNARLPDGSHRYRCCHRLRRGDRLPFNGNPGIGGSNVTLIGGSSGGTLVALAGERVSGQGCGRPFRPG